MSSNRLSPSFEILSSASFTLMERLSVAFLFCCIVFFSSRISVQICFIVCTYVVIYCLNSLNPCLCFSLSLKSFMIFLYYLSERSSMYSSCISKTEMVFWSFLRETLLFSFILLGFLSPFLMTFQIFGLSFQAIFCLCCVYGFQICG